MSRARPGRRRAIGGGLAMLAGVLAISLALFVPAVRIANAASAAHHYSLILLAGARHALSGSPRTPLPVTHDSPGPAETVFMNTPHGLIAGSTDPVIAGSTRNLYASEFAAELVAETNTARAATGLPELLANECATAHALARVGALVGAEQLSHAPMFDVHQQCDRARAGENLARGEAPPAEIVEAWLNSPGHRANLLSADFTEIGIGCVFADPDAPTFRSESMLCAQIFLGP